MFENIVKKCIRSELKASSSFGISEQQKGQFFKLYTQLSRKMKKLVGKKRNSEKIQEAYNDLISSMEKLLKL